MSSLLLPKASVHPNLFLFLAFFLLSGTCVSLEHLFLHDTDFSQASTVEFLVHNLPALQLFLKCWTDPVASFSPTSPSSPFFNPVSPRPPPPHCYCVYPVFSHQCLYLPFAGSSSPNTSSLSTHYFLTKESYRSGFGRYLKKLDTGCIYYPGILVSAEEEDISVKMQQPYPKW